MTTPRQKPLVFAYSGQGSQYYQMGYELYQSDREFRAWMERGDAAIARTAGYSVLDVVYGSAPKHEPFDDIRFTGLAVFLLEHSLTRWLEGRGIRPNLLLGYSIGELCAHVVAGTMDFETAARLIARQAEALRTDCEPAFMAAVLGEPRHLRQLAAELRSVEVACRNSERHWVLSGPMEALPRLKARADALSLVFSVLPVRYGFHSSLVDAAEPQQRTLAAGAMLGSPRLAVVSCTYGAPVARPGPDYFWDVLRGPIDLAAAAGFVSRYYGSVLYLDLGPSGTLATLLKPHLTSCEGAQALALLTPMASDTSRVAATMERLGQCGYRSSSEPSGAPQRDNDAA